MEDFLGDLLDRIENSGANFSEQAYAVVGDEVLPLLQILFIAYLAYYGFQLLMGTARVSVGDVVSRMVRMIVILILVSSWGNFNTLFYDWINDVPEDVGRAILTATGTGITEPTNGLSMIWNTANEAASAFSEQAGYFSVLPAIVAGLIMVATGIFIAIGLAVLVLAKVMLWVLIGTAPIFIACMLFDVTRRFGVGWLNQCILYALIPLFVYVVAAFLISAMDPELTQIQAKTQARELQLSDFAAFLLLCAAGAFVLIQVQVLAQGIVGGIASGLGSAARMAVGWGVAKSVFAGRRAAGEIGNAGVAANRRIHEGMRQNIRTANAEAMQNRISANSMPT
ncbi:type IV secretion system protein [Notoacmeibacter sp. MSK16QG-6]|uniref:type IV secretion system protein n=1 Tax=Notoacmeibacter sp. MSK16QG-6 TaxID=2957982 RepID=UPI0020A0D78D|nr:type IV secretion system protein [Notoacmeibacter sp. MSK16QG-6]MCP1201103.1 type IV secretion system protein [Notoacmeibacter sp. MSK16QG-6]